MSPNKKACKFQLYSIIIPKILQMNIVSFSCSSKGSVVLSAVIISCAHSELFKGYNKQSIF